MEKQLTFGDLFAGIGGLSLGLERSGMRCEWQVEIDGFCQKVLTKHWPDTPRFRDVRVCGKHNLSSVDLIAGGFPCQDISDAGKQAGIDGERSGLWKEFYRIICELRPRYVVVENVAALLHRGMGRVLGDLAACGYDAEWQILSAESVGAPHLRERIFIVAYAQSLGQRSRRTESARQFWQSKHDCDGIQISHSNSDRCWFREIQHQSGGKCKTTSHAGYDGTQRTVSNPDFQGLEVRVCFGRDARQKLTTFERNNRAGAGQWAVEPGMGRVVHGVPHRMDRIRGLGNAVVPQVAEFVGRCIMAMEAVA